MMFKNVGSCRGGGVFTIMVVTLIMFQCNCFLYCSFHIPYLLYCSKNYYFLDVFLVNFTIIDNKTIDVINDGDCISSITISPF